MNRLTYRIVFNPVRGCLMAVAETVASQGESASGERSGVAVRQLVLAGCAALSMGLSQAPAQTVATRIVADPTAPSSQRPTVLNTSNGTVQVDIRTPSAAGVSRNTYSQFDVGGGAGGGAILNNSRTNVQTQQGGWVQGNPWLATGSARVILNEVNSSNPSYLQGYVEVAGQRADVIIANPAGIAVNGGGFINASGVTLTTGTPVMTNGNLDSYRVQRGSVSVDGQGLDTRGADYTAVLARAAQLNAGIWANDLSVVTGANEIKAASLGAGNTPQASPIPGAGAAPAFALDVAQLGGMYAGKIQLLGTEAGLGVNNAGVVAANSGNLSLSHSGWLTNTGSMQASADVTIAAQGQVSNTGVVYAAGNTTLHSDNAVTNSGSLAAAGQTVIDAQSLSSSVNGKLGAGIQADGRLGASGALIVTTTQTLVANGQNLAAGNMALTGAQVDLSSSQTAAGNLSIMAAQGSVKTAQATLATRSNNGVLNITANAHADQSLDNSAGVLQAGHIELQVANRLDNTQGKIEQIGNGTLQINAGVMDNTRGTIGSNLDLSIQTTTWLNASTGSAYGSVSAGRDLSVTTTGDQNITSAAFSANRHLSFTTTGQMNVSSTLQAGGDVNLSASQISNTGHLLAGGALAVTATADTGSITNTGDMVGGSVVLKAPASITNTGPNALIGASDPMGKLVLLSNNITNTDDVTTTDTMASTTIYGVGQVVLAGGVDSAGGYTRANSIVNRSGLIESGGDMTLAANTITNTRRVLTMGSTFDQPVPATDLTALGVSLSGTTQSVSADSIGGVYIDPPHGGLWNSDYLYTNYTGTATQNAVQSISPTARIMAGGNLNFQANTLQNYWSQVAAVGDVAMPGVTLDQDSWRGTPTPQIKIAYSGDYTYRTYRGWIWSKTFCDTGCDAPGTNLYYTRSLYESSYSANGSISGSGVTLHNGSGSMTPVTPLPGSVMPAGGMAVPNNGLFKPTTNPGAHYLIETNPRFANRDQWLSSDYLLGALGKDPSTVQKRLGDASYEQKLIREQVAQLTGRQFLGDYTSTQDEYMALMNNAATASRQFDLRPGIALTPAQVAQLTTDMVWLVSQDVVLPDGSTQSVLVPQVYLSAATRMNVSRDGALVAANNIDLQDLKDFASGGTVAAKQNLNLQTAGDLNTTGGTLSAGRQMSLRAGGDIDLASAKLNAGTLDLNAGQNLNLQTLTQTTATANGTTTSLGRQTQVNVAGNAAITTGGNLNQQGAALSVGGNLAAQVGGDWNLAAVQSNETKTVNRFGGAASSNFTQNTGSSVTVGGNTTANVAGDLNVAGSRLNLGSSAQSTADLKVGGNARLSAVKDSAQVDSSWATSSGNSASSGTLHRLDETVRGASLGGAGSLNLAAGKDVNIQGSQIDTGGVASVKAGGNITVTSIAEHHESLQTHQGSHSGVVGSSASAERHESDSTTQVAALLGARTIDMKAGQDIAIQGSSVVSDQDTSLTAGRNVTIAAATNTSNKSDDREESASGLMGSGGLGVTVGNRQQSQNQQGTSTTAVASTVGSVGGNVTIKAGQTYTQTGSDVLTPKGDIDISAKTVTIEEARQSTSQSSEQQFSQSGVTLAVTSTVLSALQMADKQINAAGNTSSSRMQALAAANAAMNIKQAGDAVAAGQAKEGGNAADQAGGVGISLSAGGSSSQSQSRSSSETGRGSTVNAGGNVTIKATGAGQDSNLTVQGSDVKAGGTTSLKADNQVNLLASQNTTTESSSQSSQGGSVGIGANLGSDGFKAGVTVAANAGKGQGAGNSTTYTNSHVSGQNVSIDSGADTTLKGAVVSGNQVTANVGGNLNIQSLQDKSQYNESSKSAGGSATIGPASGGSLNLGQTKIKSDYLSVNEQSAMRAGYGGFNVHVAGGTTLTGGQITSTQAAIDNNKNTFSSAGGTTIQDLQNSASYSANSVSVGLGAGSQPGQSLSAGMSGVGIGNDKGSASSTTTAGISGVAGNAAARTGDKSTSIAPIFNKDQVQKEVAAQATITSEFGKQATKVVGDYAGKQLTELNKQVNAETDPDKKAGLLAEAAKWDEGGSYRVAMHTVIGGLTGGVQGAAGAATSQAVIDQVGQALKESNLPTELKQALVLAAGTAVGAVTGGTAGAATAFNATANNYLSATDLRNRDQRLAAARKSGNVQEELNFLKEYDAKSAKNTGAINYNSVLTEGALQAEKTQLEQLVKDPATSAETKAQAQRSINELNTAINVIQKSPVLKDAAELGLVAADVLTLGELAATKALTSTMVKEFVANRTGQAISDNAAAAISNKFYADSDFFTNSAEFYKNARAANWQTDTGRTLWPQSSGEVPGTAFQTTLPVGTKLDRMGGTSPNSTFLAPSGTPIEQRALSPTTDTTIKDEFMVAKPLPVEQSKTMPWFDKPGMGTQFDASKGTGMSGATVEKLLEEGYLKKVTP